MTTSQRPVKSLRAAKASGNGARKVRRDSEKELAEAHQRLSFALEAGRLGAWEWNPRTDEVIWSDEIYRIYGLQPGEFAGTVDAYISLIHPDDQDFVTSEIEKALETGPLEMRYRIVRPDGDVRWLMSRGMVFRDERGDPVRMTGICSDETERREEEMRLAAQYAVTRALADAEALPEAINGVLSSICEELDWAVGQIWLLDRKAGKLRFADRYASVSLRDRSFDVVSSRLSFRSGIGVPGTLLASGEPIWVSDLNTAHKYPRWKQATESGLHSAFAFPILLNREVIGVMEFFSTEHRRGTAEFLEAMAAIGSQVGQYIERRRIEDDRAKLMFELKSAETRYRSVFEQVNDAILVVDTGGRVIEANEAASEMLGYLREELLELNASEMLIGWSPDQFADLMTGNEWQGELEIMRKTGPALQVEAHSTRISLSEGDVYVGVLRDITGRRQQEKQAAFLADASSILAASLDYDETLSSLASICVPYLGDWCTVDMVDGDELRRIAVVHADPEKISWAEEFNRNHPPHLSGNDPATAMVREGKSLRVPYVGASLLRAVTQDEDMARELIELGLKSAMIVPIRARGRTLGVLTLATAESSRPYTEADQKLAEDLGRRAGLAVDNARLYMESRTAEEKLRLANAAKDEFLGLVSHELRTPMTTIRGGSRLLRRSWQRIDQESREAVLADIEQQTERLQRIVEDLLTLARVELGEEVQKEPVLAQRLVDQTVTAYSKRRPHRVIELYEDPGVAPVNGSPIYLEQVLLNLVSNADKYSPPGQPIEVHTEMRDDQVVISVLDRGPGIPLEDVDRIFERFYRSSATAEKVGGAGIGLTVCKRLIEALDGIIWAELREGGGLIVSFSLPAYDE